MTDNPTVSLDNSVYTLWFNRKEYTVLVNSDGNGDVSAETVIQPSNSITTGSTSNLTVRHGDRVKVTATASNGYTFNGWSGYVTGSTNPVTGDVITSNKNTDELGVNASFSDLSAPVGTIVSVTNKINKTSQTVSLKCTDTVGVDAYYFGTKSNVSDSDYINIGDVLLCSRRIRHCGSII